GRLADPAVTDDELALTAADRDHRVDRLYAGLEGLLHGLGHEDARRGRLDLSRHVRDDRPESVDRITEGVDDAANERWSDRDVEHAGRSPRLVAFFQLEVVTEDDGTDVVFLEVEREGDDLVAGVRGLDLEHFARHGFLQPVNARDSVLDFEDCTDFLDVELVKICCLDLTEQDVLDLAGTERGFGCHGNEGRGSGGMAGEACEFYHKLPLRASAADCEASFDGAACECVERHRMDGGSG